MNKLFCVEYCLSVTMGSVSCLKDHTKLYGALDAHQSTTLPVTNVTPILSLESLMQAINCVETLFMTFK